MRLSLRGGNNRTLLAFVAVGISVIALSTYKLSESPPVWYDEGIAMEVARHIFVDGTPMIRVAPDALVNAGQIASTGFTVTLPAAAALQLFGPGIAPARLLMCIYILGLVIAAYLLARELYGPPRGLYTLFLVASFAPLYGNGRNVLGEVPGTFFALLCLLFLAKLERAQFKGWKLYVLVGLAAGLAVATKPYFLALVLAGGIAYLLYARAIRFEWKSLVLGIVALLIPIALWAGTTYFAAGTTLGVVFGDYANPYALGDVHATMLANLRIFVAHATPLYYLLLFLVVAVGLAVRWLAARCAPAICETVMVVFAVLVAMVFLRTPGWYRYLFEGFIPLLILLPSALETILQWGGKIARAPRLAVRAGFVLLCLLVAFQAYQSAFDSWVTENYATERSAHLASYFARLDPDQSVFFYNVPEAALFMRSDDYYQYLHITDALIVGQQEIPAIYAGIPDVILLSKSDWNDGDNSLGFDKYEENERFGSYVVLVRKDS